MVVIIKKLNVLILDPNLNKDLLSTLISFNKYNIGVINTRSIKEIKTFIQIKRYDVLIVGKVETINIKEVFDIIDIFLENSKEILCIKQSRRSKSYLSNYLISNGCKYI